MNDLEIAEQILKTRNVNLVVVKDAKAVVVSDKPGLEVPLSLASSNLSKIAGAAVADQIVGKAAALLYAYMKVDSVYGVTMSQEGLKMLRRHRITAKAERLIPHIVCQDGENPCPFERAVHMIDSLEEAYRRLKEVRT